MLHLVQGIVAHSLVRICASISPIFFGVHAIPGSEQAVIKNALNMQ